MENMILLVVDVQTLLVEEHPHHEAKVLANIQNLIREARSNQVEIVYVRHDDGVGTELEVGTPGWQIFPSVAPEVNEKIVDKQFNSAFHKTDLQTYLTHKGIDTIILVGMQTEYCIDATLRSAFDLGYKVLIPLDTNTTYDNAYMDAETLLDYYHNAIWDNRFAKVVTMEQAIEKFSRSQTSIFWI